MSSQNLNDAPISTQKDIMKNEIKKECKKILEKYFEDREYNEDKVKIWKEYSLEEISNFLKSNFPDFGFVILIFIIKLGHSRSSDFQISRSDTDDFLVESIQTKSMYSEIRVNFNKIYKSTIDHIENVEGKIVLKMNELLTKYLENKIYSYEMAKNSVDEIVKELNAFLLERNLNPKPCSYQACYILSKPINMQFDYKVMNLKYMPIIATYSNDSLYAQLILFILNN